MKIKILLFGIARDIFGGSTYELVLGEGSTVSGLKKMLEQSHPQVKKLTSLMVAVNSEYAQDGQVLKENDEIALIPPVSGG